MPVEIKEIQVGYLSSPYFKDIYLYLVQNKLPSSKAAIRKVETLAEQYILLDSLLFRITSEKETAVLTVPGVCTYKIITLYHCSLFAGHQGVIKTYLRITNVFFIPNHIIHLRSYIKGCHICQLAHNEETTYKTTPNQNKPKLCNFIKTEHGFKIMPRSYRGYKFILYIIDEVTNNLITVPVHQAKSEVV